MIDLQNVMKTVANKVHKIIAWLVGLGSSVLRGDCANPADWFVGRENLRANLQDWLGGKPILLYF